MHGIRDDLMGMRFGRLVVIRLTDERVSNHIVWECECDCGNLHKTAGFHLKSRKTESCGCLNRENHTKHGGKGTRLYKTWCSMFERCRGGNSRKSERYYIRGISVCKEWRDFAVFRKWALANGYSDDLSIDRKDNDKGYFPGNCQWLTKSFHAVKSTLDTPVDASWRQRNWRGQFIHEQ